MSSIRLRRRSLLALAGAGLTSGCVRQFESAVARDEHRPLSLKIKTVPADADAAATRLARYLATRLQNVGISTTVVPMSREELLRSVLVNHDFDMYVYRLPVRQDPDFLRPLLHSRYAPESGWQNPFGYGNLSLDSLLERQRTELGGVRHSTLVAIQRHLAENQPFTPVAIPDSARATRLDRVGWPADTDIHSVAGYLGARPVESEGAVSDVQTTAEPTTDGSANDSTTASTTQTTTPSPAENTLRMTLTDARPSENLNPLSTPFRSDGSLVRLLYDSLGRSVDGEMHPWMAASWEWFDDEETTTLLVRLRDGLEWHDGEPITAEDVDFTFRFISDTALGSLDQPVPSPRFRDRASLVDTVARKSPSEVTLRFGDVSEPVASRALTVPILPKHVWEEFAHQTSVPWLDGGNVTEALVRNNLDPVGSGPLRVTGTALRESVTMEPFESHFLSTGTLDDELDRFAGGFSFDALEFSVVPSDGAAVELLANDAADATANSLSSSVGETAAGMTDLAVRTGQSRWCYHVGYNHRHAPFTNPRFRRAVARLIDRPYLVESVFGDDATGVLSPLETTEYAPDDDQWGGVLADLEFVGQDGTGTLDADRARSMFEGAGYTYSSDGTVLIQE